MIVYSIASNGKMSLGALSQLKLNKTIFSPLRSGELNRAPLVGGCLMGHVVVQVGWWWWCGEFVRVLSLSLDVDFGILMNARSFFAAG